jgi:hypothetical protein
MRTLNPWRCNVVTKGFKSPGSWLNGSGANDDATNAAGSHKPKLIVLDSSQQRLQVQYGSVHD